MERIGSSVERELARGGQPGGASSLAATVAAWRAAVGEVISRNAWPLRIGRDGTLHVATVSATWALELDRMAPEIAAKLAERLGDAAPAKLRFAVGPVPEPAAPDPVPAPRQASAEMPPGVAAEASEAAARIEDPELRELALRAARASLSRRPSDRRF